MNENFEHKRSLSMLERMRKSGRFSELQMDALEKENFKGNISMTNGVFTVSMYNGERVDIWTASGDQSGEAMMVYQRADIDCADLHLEVFRGRFGDDYFWKLLWNKWLMTLPSMVVMKMSEPERSREKLFGF